jgi:hypothetical protein
MRMWKIIKKLNSIWYFDATGNVLRDVPNKGKPFLYSLVAHDTKLKKIIPIAEFVTTAHNQDNISSFLFNIGNHFKSNLNSWLPSIVVTDFSYALINSVCSAFNHCDLGQYISNTFEYLKNPQDQTLRDSIQTIMYLCSAHFLKMTIRTAKKIFKKEKTHKVIQDVFKFSFSLFQNGTTWASFSSYSNTFTIYL